MTSVESAKIPRACLKTVNPHTIGRGAKGRDPIDKSALTNAGVPGIDSLTNFTSEFTAPGFDGVGNPQSVWPYTMVGRAPERGRSTRINAPIIPTVLDLLAPDGSVASYKGQPLSFDPGGLVRAAVRSPMFEPFRYFSGFTQFNDAMMRSQFWHVIRGQGDDDGYHVLLNPSVKTTVSGVMLPPEWLPTSSTGPSGGMLWRPRTSARK